ncbi:MAG TPA: hypothetical protein VFU35_06460 [Jatrophihabitans sp.]|nr:hypothetical protein [Jatrophihabitans sp.]
MTEASDRQLDPAQDALVTLVIRGMIRGTPDEATQQLVEQGLALTKGPITMPTPQGTEDAGKLLRIAPASEQEQEIDKLFDAFLPINRKLRDVCSAWQTRPDGTPNDHSDVAYDDSVRERLDEVHSSIGPILRRLGAAAPRLAGYRPRLQAALDKFDDGENAWLASPLMDSYHTVWMHMHQELILMLGLTRAEDEAREERLVAGRAG